MSEAARARIVIPFLIVTAIWGSTWLVIKDQISSVPPSWTVTYRFAVAFVLMCALAAIRGETLRLPRSSVVLAAMVGLLQFCGNFEFVYRAEAHLTSGVVAVCFALLLVPNALLARVFLGQRVSPRFVGGSVVALGGIVLLMRHEYHDAPPGGQVILGFVFVACALLSASGANLLQASRLGHGVRPVPLLAWAMGWGVLLDAAFALAVDGAPVIDPRPVYLLGVAYLALFGSVVTFPLYFGLIRALGPGRAAYSSVAVPVVAMTLSTLFESYRWTGMAVAGAALALGGLAIALSGRAAASSAITAASPATNEA